MDNRLVDSMIDNFKHRLQNEDYSSLTPPEEQQMRDIDTSTNEAMLAMKDEHVAALSEIETMIYDPTEFWNPPTTSEMASSANGHIVAKDPRSSPPTGPPSASVARDVLSIYVPTLFLIFFGCCSNVYTLESLVSTDPSLGPLLTFVQFVFVSLFSSSSCLYFSSTAPFIHLKPRQVPVRKWLVYTILFMAVNLLNNSAFGYKISVPLHIILRSAGPVASMTVAYLFNNARYAKVKVAAVAFLFVGVVLAALSDSHARSTRVQGLANQTLGPDAGVNKTAVLKQQAPGFLIILLALILSAFLGLYTDKLYSQHGRSAQATAESLFYSHTLSIPFFSLHLQALSNNFRALATSSPPLSSLVAVHTLPVGLAPTSTVQQLLSSIPTAAAMLILNALTHAKLFNTFYNHVYPTLRAKYSSPGIRVIFRQQIQPWHPSSTLVHEAGAAVLRTAPDRFWEFSRVLFESQKEFFDVSVVNEVRNQTYARLAKLAASVEGIDEAKILKLLKVSDKPGEDGALNTGNETTNDVKLMVKMNRLTGVHVTPTVVWNGVVEGSISSSWTKEQWEEWLDKNAH
ncbi:hypothetical protein DV737_g1592, partial [Chaetothyriales sp. CBS 132003]